MNRTNRLWSFLACHTIQRWPGREATKTAARMIRTPADQKDLATPDFCEYLQTGSGQRQCRGPAAEAARNLDRGGGVNHRQYTDELVK